MWKQGEIIYAISRTAPLNWSSECNLRICQSEAAIACPSCSQLQSTSRLHSSVYALTNLSVTISLNLRALPNLRTTYSYHTLSIGTFNSGVLRLVRSMEVGECASFHPYLDMLSSLGLASLHYRLPRGRVSAKELGHNHVWNCETLQVPQGQGARPANLRNMRDLTSQLESLKIRLAHKEPVKQTGINTCHGYLGVMPTISVLNTPPKPLPSRAVQQLLIQRCWQLVLALLLARVTSKCVLSNLVEPIRSASRDNTHLEGFKIILSTHNAVLVHERQEVLLHQPVTRRCTLSNSTS